MNFEQLHRSGTFVLVNAHDAGAAAIAQDEGAVAIGTTSSGHAYTLGRRDAVGAISRPEALSRAEQICAAVQVPVSVDAENGWGHAPEDVARTISDLADIGAAGASLEDWSSDPDIGLYDTDIAVERITAAVETAAALREPFVICARAEGFLYGQPPVDEIISRLNAFAAAGAQCVFATGPQDPVVLRRLVEETHAPINALLPFGSTLTVDDARAIGIRRVSVGGSLYRATIAAYASLVKQLLTDGTLTSQPLPLPTAKIEALFQT